MDQLTNNDILQYLRTGQSAEEFQKNQKDAMKRKSKNFLEKSGKYILKGNAKVCIAHADYQMMHGRKMVQGH